MLEDRWILSRLATVTQQVTDYLDRYRYADAARTLYGFAWDEFCSFYVEMTKARFAVAVQRAVAQQVIAHALDTLLRLLHPITPFVTEEVWQLLGQAAPVRGVAKPQAAGESVCVAPWPTVDTARIDETIEQQFAQFQAVMGAVREVRQAQNIPPKEPVRFTVRCDAATAQLLEPMKPYFDSMARATALEFGPAAKPPERSASKSLTGMEVHVDISAFFDVDAERARLEKERDQLEKRLASIEKKLANPAFSEKAPREIVEQQRTIQVEVRQQIKFVDSAIDKLSTKH
jgi:valyl-tRNA synthetase